MSYSEWEAVIIDQTQDDRVVEFPCRRCEGTGTDPDLIDRATLAILTWEQSPCNGCDGHGVVRLMIPDRPTNCGNCQGTGRVAYCQNVLFSRNQCKALPCIYCQSLGIRSLTGRIEKLS